LFLKRLRRLRKLIKEEKQIQRDEIIVV
jgi:hypothetical protein